MENIVVAFRKPEDGQNIRKILVRNGIPVTVLCTCGAQVLSHAGDLGSGIVVCGFSFGDMDCRQLKRQLPAGFDLLTVASPGRWSGEEMGEIVCLPAPFKACDLVSTVRMVEAAQTARRKQARRQKPVRSEEEKKIIGEAKELLIRRNHMTEPEAHRYLQKISMDSGRNMAKTAEMLLSLMKSGRE